MQIIKQLFIVNGTVTITVKGSSKATDLLRCESETKSAHCICKFTRIEGARVVTIYRQKYPPGV